MAKLAGYTGGASLTRVTRRARGGVRLALPSGRGAIISEEARWLQARQEELKAAQTQQQFAKLADGDTDSFLVFADAQLRGATTDEEKKFWQDWINRTRERIADENIAADLAAGNIELEEMEQYILDKLTAAEVGSIRYSSLVRQLGEIRNGIEARGFNEQMQKAQLDLVNTGDKKSYLQKLQYLMSVAKDPKVQSQLLTQIGTLKNEIEKDRILDRSREINQLMIDYQTGKTPASEVMARLNELAAQADTPEEANRYTSLAGQVIARERQIAADAVSAARRAATAARGAGGGGGTGGLSSEKVNNALAPIARNFKAARDRVQDTLADGRMPTPSEWSEYDRWRTLYKKAIDEIYPYASEAAKRSLDTELETISDQVMTYRTQAGAVVKEQAGRINTRLQSLVEQLDNTKNVDLGSTVSEIFDNLAKLEGLQSNPYMNTGQRQDVLFMQNEAVRRMREQVTTMERKFGDGATAANIRLGDLYNDFMDRWRGKKGTTEGVPGFEEWRNLITTEGQKDQAIDKALGDLNLSADYFANVRQAAREITTEFTPPETREGVLGRQPRPRELDDLYTAIREEGSRWGTALPGLLPAILPVLELPGIANMVPGQGPPQEAGSYADVSNLSPIMSGRMSPEELEEMIRRSQVPGINDRFAGTRATQDWIDMLYTIPGIGSMMPAQGGPGEAYPWQEAGSYVDVTTGRAGLGAPMGGAEVDEYDSYTQRVNPWRFIPDLPVDYATPVLSYEDVFDTGQRRANPFRFGDPFAAAESMLSAPIEFPIDSWVVPELPPEPVFARDFQLPDISLPQLPTPPPLSERVNPYRFEAEPDEPFQFSFDVPEDVDRNAAAGLMSPPPAVTRRVNPYRFGEE